MVEYLDENHIYLVDGVIVTSVTQLLQWKFKDKYKNVPKSILESKAEYGTKVHKLVEIINRADNHLSVIEAVNEFNYIMANTLEQYMKIVFNNDVEVIEQEQIVYNDILAGRYDLLAKINGIKSLCDIKTTASLDKEYLSWQLSIYNYLNKEKADRLYAIWLPKKELAKLEEIEFKKDEEIKNLIEEWRKINMNSACMQKTY
ncbi:MAG: hypothetical protein RSD14_04925 [Clostridia bacterium]